MSPVVLLEKAYPYRQGAEFTRMDWRITALSGHWPEGSRWEVTLPDGESFEVRIEDGEAVRIKDGAVLEGYASRSWWDTKGDERER